MNYIAQLYEYFTHFNKTCKLFIIAIFPYLSHLNLIMHKCKKMYNKNFLLIFHLFTQRHYNINFTT